MVTDRDLAIARWVSDWHCRQNMANDQLITAVVSDEALRTQVQAAINVIESPRPGHTPKDPVKIKFKCPKGNHKNWHYLPVWWVDEHEEVHYTVVECYGSGKKKRQAQGYCKPFTWFGAESELFLALHQMAADVMRYPAMRVETNPWE